MGTIAFNQSDLGITAVFLFIFIVLALLITGMGIHQRIRNVDTAILWINFENSGGWAGDFVY